MYGCLLPMLSLRSIKGDRGGGDHGLNSAIQKLREALGDSADRPRFVETVPRRGYRFIAPVEKPGEATIQGVERRQVEEANQARPANRRRALVVALSALAL